MKILVAGGAGYIGSHVVKAILKAGHQAVVYDDLSSGQRINLFPQAEFIQGDILDYAALKEAMSRNIDAVVHLAGKKAVGESMLVPEKYAVNNITGALNIINAMAECGVKHIVFSSSAAVYGMPEYLPVDEKHPLNPINYYGFTKLEFERNLEWYSRLKDFSYMALRYFNAVGYDAEGDIRGKELNPQNLLPIIIEAATGKRECLNVFGNDYETRDGTCVRDYVHVTDLAKAHVMALEKLMDGAKSEVINLGTNTGTTVKEVIQAAEKVIGKKLNVKYVERRPGDPAELVASYDKAKKVLGWEPDYKNIEDIVRTTWNMENLG
ncbi:MAG: UDP-glucose 4-epimerase GalE [Alphaproteobacteria bacterium]|nr:UDP-glucose 4-epimerase GalE [Alphaproteobacteria bacterium]